MKKPTHKPNRRKVVGGKSTYGRPTDNWGNPITSGWAYHLPGGPQSADKGKD